MHSSYLLTYPTTRTTTRHSCDSANSLPPMRRAAFFACGVACVDGQLTFHSGGRGPDRVDYVYKPLRGDRQPNQGGIFSGIVPGAAIVAAAGSLLWWNEGRTMRRERLLETARRQLWHGAAGGDEREIDPAAPERLLHLTGWLRSADGVSDSVFPQVKGELGLERMSEVFQWLEDERVNEVRTSSTPRTKPSQA
jgi:hypothetical protein